MPLNASGEAEGSFVPVRFAHKLFARGRQVWGKLHPWVTLGGRVPPRRMIWAVLMTAVALAIGYQVVKNWQEISQYPWRLDYIQFLKASLAFSVSLMISVLCWSLILRQLGSSNSFGTNARLYCTTNLARRLPTPIWFLGSRMMAYKEMGVRKGTTLSAMMLEGIVTAFGGLVVAIFSLPFGPYAQVVQQSVGVFPFLIPIIIFVIRPAWLFAIVNVVLRRVKIQTLEVKLRPLDMLIWSGLFATNWTLGGLLLYYLVNVVYPISASLAPAMINIWSVAGVVTLLGHLTMLLPAGFGVKQLIAAYLLSFYIPWPAAVLVAILSRLSVTLLEVFWMLVWQFLDRAWWKRRAKA